VILDASPARERWFVGLGAASAFVAVAAGAFGAHGLRDALPADRLEVFETAARYQMFHALSLIVAGMLSVRRRGRGAPAAGWLFLIGTVLFSGSLYALALSGVRAFGAVTPVGGVAWLVGWAFLGLSAMKPRVIIAEIEPEEVITVGIEDVEDVEATSHNP
jgi:uncharacterized membrane protein YgdD (TMEM256/DUF423 family)